MFEQGNDLSDTRYAKNLKQKMFFQWLSLYRKRNG